MVFYFAPRSLVFDNLVLYLVAILNWEIINKNLT
jgi:hypothetical protein